MWVHTQPTAGSDNREDSPTPNDTKPCQPLEAAVGAGPQQLHTSHSTQEAKEKAEGHLG